jgi:hypothetical protein
MRRRLLTLGSALSLLLCVLAVVACIASNWFPWRFMFFRTPDWQLRLYAASEFGALRLTYVVEGDLVTEVPLSWWVPVLSLGAIALTLQWIAARLATSFRRGLCPRCGYDLRASPERCPECGTANPAGISN